MKYVAGILSGAMIVGQQAQGSIDGQIIKVENLADAGINHEVVLQSFKDLAGIDLQPSDALKVTADEEGKNLKFETLDHLSLVVDIRTAAGTGNKDNLQD